MPDDPLALRAGDRLAAAGRRAFWRGDQVAATALLERALELTRPLRLDVALELDLVSAVRDADWKRAAASARGAVERADDAGDRTGALVARVVERARDHVGFDPDEVEALAREALPLLEQAGDHAALVHVWDALGLVANQRCRFDDVVRAFEQVRRHAVLSGQQAGYFRVPYRLVSGSRAADEALEALAAAGAGAHPKTQLAQAWLLAMLGRFDEARGLATEVAPRYREVVGNRDDLKVRAQIEALAGDYEHAIALQREQCLFLEQSDELGALSTFLPLIGRWLCMLGRHDEAEPLARRGRELTTAGDLSAEACGGRRRRASTRTAATTTRPSGSRARRSRSPSRPTR